MDRWKKQKQSLESAAALLLEEALRAGAERAEVCASYGAKTRIGFEKQDFHLASSDDGFQFGLRVLCQSRQGFVSGNSLLKADLKEMAKTAVRIAKVSPANEFYTIEASGNISQKAPTEFWDDAVVDLSLATQKDWAKSFVGEAMKDSRFRLNEGSVSVDGTLFLVMNSLGTHHFHRESMCGWSLMGMAAEGEKITSFDYFSEMARTLASLPDRMVHSAAEFRDRVLTNLNMGPATSYRGRAVFSPRATLDVLVRPLLYHLNGRNMVEGATRWKPANLGEKVVSEKLSVDDTPWNVERFGATPFDREGTPTQDRNLIAQGKIAAFVLDQYAAKALTLTSTGNATGGPAAIPSAGTHNVRVAPGSLSLEAWMRTEAKGPAPVLLVNRFSGRTDPVTGDFSGVAKGAEWIVNGERVYVVQDTLISGNIFETLSQNLLGLSQESSAIDCSGDSPYLFADGVSVTAGGH